MAALGWLLNLDFAIGPAQSEDRTGTGFYDTVEIEFADTIVKLTLADVPVRRMYFQAASDNANDIYLGGAAVDSTDMGRRLEPGDVFTVDYEEGRPGNINNFCINGSGVGDKMHYVGVPVGSN